MKSLETALLLDFYGNLLTEKMRGCMEMYYYDDMSLAEIADSENISRQGVHDTIKRAQKTLEEYENKLGLAHRFQEQTETVRVALNELSNGDIKGCERTLTELIDKMTEE